MPHKKKKKENHIPKKKSSKSPLSGKNAVGILDVSRGGLGFVKIEGWEQDVLVRPEQMSSAFDGDQVKVTIEHVSSKGRPEGSIIEVLKRTQTEFSGRLEVSDKFAFLVPDKENMRVDIFVPLHALKGGKQGEHAIVRVVDWNGKSKKPVGEVIELLTNQRTNEIAMKSILVESGFPLHFSDDALEEAARIPDILDSDEIKRRKDCRNVLTLTIDPVLSLIHI